MVVVHTVEECEECEVQPGYIQEILDVDPTNQVSIGDIVLDANGAVWLITHSNNIWDNVSRVEFYRPGAVEPSHVQDICWCRAGKPINDRYEHHINTDPHGPFRLLVVEGS